MCSGSKYVLLAGDTDVKTAKLKDSIVTDPFPNDLFDVNESAQI